MLHGARSTLRCGKVRTHGFYALFGRSMSSCGLVGMPNVGKSTLFNALTNTQSAESANYPFCTIEPNLANVGIPDSRLDELARITKSEKTVYAQLEFVDVAGLVKGAASGAGLGNKFLQNIRDVSVILHVLRCYDDTDIVHVEESIDPVRDMDIIETELILADLQSVEKRLGNLKKKMTFNTGDRELNQLKAILEKCFAALDQGKPLRSLNHTWGGDDVRVLKTLQLLTNKPLAYVLNVDEESAVTGNTHTKAVCDVIQQRLDEEYTAQHGDEADADAGAGADGAHRRLSADDVTVMTSAALEAEAAASFDTLEGQLEFLQLADVETTGLQNTIKLSAELLQLEHYYTLGPKEARAWRINKGSLAPEAAGKIHSDMQNGFIVAEVIKPDDYMEAGSESQAKQAGKVKQAGKTYVVEDGDIMKFKFNKTKGNK